MAAKDWCFTLNNYEKMKEQELTAAINELKEASNYLIIGKEKGESGTPHLQCFVQLKDKLRLKKMKNFRLLAKAHLEKRMGSPQEASEYCKKDGDFQEEGKLSVSGGRTDLKEIRETLSKTGRIRAVVNNEKITYQQIRFAEKYLQYAEPVRNWIPTVYWLYGPTGTGKSKAARAICGAPEDTYVKNTSDKWWAGYDGHPSIILDDFDQTWMSYQEMLSLLDRYERSVEYKGGNRQILARTIVVTSQYKPDIYYSAKGDIAQLNRRITVLREFSDIGDGDRFIEEINKKDEAEETPEPQPVETDDDEAEILAQDTPPEELAAKRRKMNYIKYVEAETLSHDECNDNNNK